MKAVICHTIANSCNWTVSLTRIRWWPATMVPYGNYWSAKWHADSEFVIIATGIRHQWFGFRTFAQNSCHGSKFKRRKRSRHSGGIHIESSWKTDGWVSIFVEYFRFFSLEFVPWHFVPLLYYALLNISLSCRQWTVRPNAIYYSLIWGAVAFWSWIWVLSGHQFNCTVLVLGPIITKLYVWKTSLFCISFCYW